MLPWNNGKGKGMGITNRDPATLEFDGFLFISHMVIWCFSFIFIRSSGFGLQTQLEIVRQPCIKRQPNNENYFESNSFSSSLNVVPSVLCGTLFLTPFHGQNSYYTKCTVAYRLISCFQSEPSCKDYGLITDFKSDVLNVRSVLLILQLFYSCRKIVLVKRRER